MQTRGGLEALFVKEGACKRKDFILDVSLIFCSFDLVVVDCFERTFSHSHLVVLAWLSSTSGPKGVFSIPSSQRRKPEKTIFPSLIQFP